MSETIDINIRLDKETKERAEQMFDDFGLNLSTAVTIFLRQALRKGAFPFKIGDPFYSEHNQERLRQSIASYEAGRVVVKTMEELEAMENG
ncbi:MAG: type II toxin-antitoxin system RelB/DinJ family antitoxin [Planctomycetaceae bacterium]|jgi:DNA-damage-inducible protein J|nr:type II toxin-antitoxin system RelB/DinJ family antitoxin [Planctomycetaceae bacterium]